MTLKAFAAQIRKDYPKLKRCYIAIMPNDDTAEYDLEVEVVPQAEIGGTYATGTASLEEAREMADDLEAALGTQGIVVAATRKDWEGA